MQKARFIGIGYLLICGLIIGLVSQGLLAPSAPVAVFPTLAPKPTATFNPANAITLEMVYSTEKETWLQNSLAAWQATNPTVNGKGIQVQLRGMGSQEIVTQLEQGQIKPTIISPASSSQVNQLNSMSIQGVQNIAADSQPLLFTPLVLITWNDSQGPASELSTTNDVFNTLHDLTVENFSNRSFLFSQTQPNESNSGLQTFILMAYTYHNKSSGLTVADIEDPGFRTWMTEYARNLERFSSSTNTLIQDMIRFGPSKYNAIAAYESSALEYMDNASNRWGELRLIYPEQNIWSDHPFAVIEADWVSADQREAAALFREFLLNSNQQTAAIEHGFRPSNPDIGLDIANSPFTEFAPYGVNLDINQLVQDPSGDVISALLKLWEELLPQVNR